MTDIDAKPVIDVARENIIEGEDEVYALDDGTLVKLMAVPAAIIDDVMSRIQNPPIPMWHNNDYDREEPNPSDPQYLIAVAEAERKRTSALIDTVIMFGATLVDGMPESDAWLEKLKMLEARNYISLAGYNLEDSIEKEFVYKRFSMPMWMISRIQEISALSQEEVVKSKRLFRGKAKK